MSSPDTRGEPDKPQEAVDAEHQDNDSVASKLSKELSNWRRRRTSSRSHRPDGPSQNYKSEPARTIKVRGHETLVVRKPKLTVGKPPSIPTPDSNE
jgi:hypothetical protein